MKLSRSEDLARGNPIDDPAHFSGEVRQELVYENAENGARVLAVRFSPGGRTFWHRHPGGQVLHVTEGRGLVQSWGEAARELHEGATVVAGAGEKHWHGAGPGSELVHLAVSLGPTQWEEEVRD